MKAKIAKIVNEDLIRSYWASAVFNIFILLLIVLSFVQIILEVEPLFANQKSLFRLLDAIIIGVFTIEYILRFWTSDILYERFKGKKGRLRYFFSFYALVDFLAILPFYIVLFTGATAVGVFKILRLLRIFRFLKYISSFAFILKAIKSKKNELLISLGMVGVLLIIASTVMYYLEHKAQPDAFSNILATMWWGVATLTTVGYGDIYPITAVGKLLGGVIAILGVGLFALPAGIIASGFVEEMEKDRKEKDIQEKAKMVEAAFQRVQHNSLLGFKVKRRFLTLAYLKARLTYTEDEIFEVVRSSNNLRIKWAKSSSQVRNEDMIVLEHFEPNTTYGEQKNREAKITIVNPIGRGERAVSHFSKTLAQYGGFNVISNEIFSSGDIFPEHKFQFDINKNYSKEERIGPQGYHDFCEDIASTIANDSWAIVIRSASANRKNDLHLLLGGAKGDVSLESIAQPTVNSLGKVANLLEHLKKTFEEEEYRVTTHEEFKSTSPSLLHQFIRKETRANVLTLFINIELLTMENKAYYRFTKKLGDVLKTLIEG